MKEKLPRIQRTWREFKDRRIESISILDGWKIITDIQELLYDTIVPHLLATHWYSTFSRPRKFKGHRKNRNI